MGEGYEQHPHGGGVPLFQGREYKPEAQPSGKQCLTILHEKGWTAKQEAVA